jgi:LPXTG-motif cell wall-anchored protein
VLYPLLTVLVSSTGVTLAPDAPTQNACDDCTELEANDTVAIGEVVVLKLSGYKPHEWVTVTMRSTPVELGRFQADANGVVNIRFTIPRNGAVGSSHTLTFSGSLGTPDFVLPFTLGAPAKALAYTGADVTVPLALGGALVLVGGGALVVARRRKTESVSA